MTGLCEYRGYSEFVPIPSYKYLIKIDKKYNLKPEELMPESFDLFSVN